MNLPRKLTTRAGAATVVLYLLGSIAAGLLAALLFGGLATSPDERIVDGVIDSGMYANLIISVLLVFTCLVVFKEDARDIFFEKARFGLSKLYFAYPLALVGVSLWAFANVELAAYSVSVILLVVLASLAIAVNEEIVTRGMLLVGLRNGGVREWQVFAITTVTFGLLHAINLLGGSNATQILATLAGGTLYYVSRRVFNHLFAPIFLHAVYDTAFFLLTGAYAQEAGSLPGHVLDVQLGSFLILSIAAILFLVFGRGLLRTAPAT